MAKISVIGDAGRPGEAGPPAASAPAGDRQAAFEAGRAALAERIAARKATAATRLTELMADAPLGAAARSEVKTIAHQLAGICGAFGEPTIGGLARRVDDLARRGDDDTALRRATDELLAALVG